MKRILLAGVLLSGLSACDHDPYTTNECVAVVDDGWTTQPYTAYHVIGYGHHSHSIPYTAWRQVHHTHCGQYAPVCHPGYRNGKVIPCGR